MGIAFVKLEYRENVLNFSWILGLWIRLMYKRNSHKIFSVEMKYYYKVIKSGYLVMNNVEAYTNLPLIACLLRYTFFLVESLCVTNILVHVIPLSYI